MPKEQIATLHKILKDCFSMEISRMPRKPLVPYTISTDHSLCIKLLPVIQRLTTGVFGRGFGFAMRQLKMFYQRKLAFATFPDQSRFYFEIGDLYWNKLILSDYDYESELKSFLSLVKDVDYVFIDAGANLGYWSVLASSEMFGGKDVISIEASSDTLQMLQRNCEKNKSRFTVQHNAIFNEDGRELLFSTGAHAGRHIEGGDTQDGEGVKSITLDRVIADHGISDTTGVVVKLDVEGAEIAAIQGCRNLMKQEFVIIYEDHGKDKKHEPTDYILNHLVGSVFFVEPLENGDVHVQKVTSLAEMDIIKKDPSNGYNFFFCKEGSIFENILNKAGQSQT